jgi:hypothetical protein
MIYYKFYSMLGFNPHNHNLAQAVGSIFAPMSFKPEFQVLI